MMDSTQLFNEDFNAFISAQAAQTTIRTRRRSLSDGERRLRHPSFRDGLLSRFRGTNKPDGHERRSPVDADFWRTQAVREH